MRRLIRNTALLAFAALVFVIVAIGISGLMVRDWCMGVES